MVDERVISVKLKQIEQYHGELKRKQETLSNREFLSNTLVAAIGFRNVLAHEYGHINNEEVYEILQTGLSVYDTYSQQIAQWTKGTN